MHFWYQPFIPSQAAAETVTVDKWYQPGAKPPLALPVAAAILASGFAWAPQTITPPAETVTVDKWLPAQTQPVREPPRPRGAIGFTALAPDFVTADRWLPQHTRPVLEAPRPRGAIAAALDLTFNYGWRGLDTRPAFSVAVPRSALAWTAFVAAAEIVTVDKWWSHPATPSRAAWRPVDGSAWTAFVETPAETITADKWLPWATRPDYRVHFIGRQVVADPPWDTSTPVVEPEAVSVTGGYPPFWTTEDKRRKRKRQIVEEVAMAVAAEAPAIANPQAVARKIVRKNPQQFSVLDAETLALIRARIADIEARALARQLDLDDEEDIEILLLSS